MLRVKKIRIMHVVRTLATGGTENVVRRLLSTLDPDRFEQRVCTVVASPSGSSIGAISLDRDPHRSAFLVPQLVRLFRRERPHVVHSRNWATIEAVIAAKFAGVAGVVHSEHGRDLNTMGRQPMRRRLLRRMAYASADRVFCVSQELRQYYSRELGISLDSFDVIANGVDIRQFCPDPGVRQKRRAQLEIAPGTFVVGTVGRLDPVKDHRTLIRAAASAIAAGVNLHLVIVGEGSQRSVLENEVEAWPELARRTAFTGEVRNVAEWLNAFDAFVLPSLSEGMSNTLLEAMAVGIACVATAVGGNVEVVENGRSGLFVRPGDVAGIRDCLVRLACVEELRHRLGWYARERIISEFSLDRALRRYEEMYCSLRPQKMTRSEFSRGKIESSAQKLENY